MEEKMTAEQQRRFGLHVLLYGARKKCAPTWVYTMKVPLERHPFTLTIPVSGGTGLARPPGLFFVGPFGCTDSVECLCHVLARDLAEMAPASCQVDYLRIIACEHDPEYREHRLFYEVGTRYGNLLTSPCTDRDGTYAKDQLDAVFALLQSLCAIKEISRAYVPLPESRTLMRSLEETVNDFYRGMGHEPDEDAMRRILFDE